MSSLKQHLAIEIVRSFDCVAQPLRHGFLLVERNKKFNTVGTVPKSNRKIVRKRQSKIDTLFEF